MKRTEQESTGGKGKIYTQEKTGKTALFEKGKRGIALLLQGGKGTRGIDKGS